MEKTTKKNEKKGGFKSHIQYAFIIYILSLIGIFAFYRAVPKYYKATSSVLQPPEREFSVDTGTEFSSQLRTNTDLFFSILNSRTMKDGIIERFELIDVYNEANLDMARRRMEKNTIISLTKEKIIEIQVIDTSPSRAAEIANSFIEELDNTVKNLALTTAKQDREFADRRLSETENNINSLQKRLSEIQKKDKLIADKELAQISQTAGKFMQEAFTKKIELERQKRILSDNSIEIIMLEEELKDIEDALARLLFAENEIISIMRELRAQEDIYGLLTSKLEEAKINEARDTPVVQVLDKAVVPEQIYKPDIKVLILLQSLIVGALAVIIFFFDLLKYLGSI